MLLGAVRCHALSRSDDIEQRVIFNSLVFFNYLADTIVFFRSFNQTQLNQPFCQVMYIFLAAGLAKPEGDDQDQNFFVFDPEDNPLALANSSQAAIPRQFSD
ncbi:MAG: hypothetical protein ACYDGS_00260 [Thermoleophilia bacterium]